MKIAHIVPHSITFPLEQHNGRYDWVLNIAKIQVQNGHEVTIYCNPESQVEGVRTQGISNTTSDKKQNNIETFRLAFGQDHDIYHSHFDNLHYEVAHKTNKQIVFTQHWWPDQLTVSLAQNFKSGNVWAVPPTKYMLEFDKSSGIPTKGYIYHGIDLTQADNITPVKNGRLLFLSRIAPEKNLPLAIDISKITGVGLDIVGKVADKNLDYFKSIEPSIDGTLIKYHGPKPHSEVGQYLANSIALMFPSDVNEPFGLVAIESQLYGTPVIMQNGGSRGELIIDGKTGFLCSNQEDYINAVNNVNNLSAEDCRNFSKNFNEITMEQDYAKLYESLS